MGIRFKATHVVLAMLCAMYFITYVDRVNIGTAASEIQKELGLSNTQLGLVFSAFAYPYLLFQVIGGWVGDRFGPRKTLFWCGMIWAVATISTGFVNGLAALFVARFALGFGEGATFPTATRAMQYWTPANRRGFAQGLTHSFARLGNAVTPPVVALLILWLTWRGAFVVLGFVSLIWGVVWVWYFRNEPTEHASITEAEPRSIAAAPGRRAAARAVGPAARADVAGDPDLFLLRLVPVAVPELAAAVLQEQLQPRHQEFGPVRLRRLLRRRGRRQRRRRAVGQDPRSDRQCPPGAAQRHRHGVHGSAALAAADPVRPRHHRGRAVPVGRFLLCRVS